MNARYRPDCRCDPRRPLNPPEDHEPGCPVAPEFPQRVREAMGEIQVWADEVQRKEAAHWIVGVVDPELPQPFGFAYGPFETPEEALVFAGTLHEKMKEVQAREPETPGWFHVVVPVILPEDC